MMDVICIFSTRHRWDVDYLSRCEFQPLKNRISINIFSPKKTQASTVCEWMKFLFLFNIPLWQTHLIQTTRDSVNRDGLPQKVLLPELAGFGRVQAGQAQLGAHQASVMITTDNVDVVWRVQFWQKSRVALSQQQPQCVGFLFPHLEGPALVRKHILPGTQRCLYPSKNIGNEIKFAPTVGGLIYFLHFWWINKSQMAMLSEFWVVLLKLSGICLFNNLFMIPPDDSWLDVVSCVFTFFITSQVRQ